MYITHLSIHLIVVQYLSCFYLLPAVNYAAMSIHVYIFVWLCSFLLGYILRVKLLGQIVLSKVLQHFHNHLSTPPLCVYVLRSELCLVLLVFELPPFWFL